MNSLSPAFRRPRDALYTRRIPRQSLPAWLHRDVHDEFAAWLDGQDFADLVVGDFVHCGVVGEAALLCVCVARELHCVPRREDPVVCEGGVVVFAG